MRQVGAYMHMLRRVQLYFHPADPLIASTPADALATVNTSTGHERWPPIHPPDRSAMPRLLARPSIRLPTPFAIPGVKAYLVLRVAYDQPAAAGRSVGRRSQTRAPREQFKSRAKHSIDNRLFSHNSEALDVCLTNTSAELWVINLRPVCAPRRLSSRTYSSAQRSAVLSAAPLSTAPRFAGSRNAARRRAAWSC